jgi:hypothetical protein
VNGGFGGETPALRAVGWECGEVYLGERRGDCSAGWEFGEYIGGNAGGIARLVGNLESILGMLLRVKWTRFLWGRI